MTRVATITVYYLRLHRGHGEYRWGPFETSEQAHAFADARSLRDARVISEDRDTADPHAAIVHTES